MLKWRQTNATNEYIPMEMARTFARSAAANTLTGALRFAAIFLFNLLCFELCARVSFHRFINSSTVYWLRWVNEWMPSHPNRSSPTLRSISFFIELRCEFVSSRMYKFVLCSESHDREKFGRSSLEPYNDVRAYLLLALRTAYAARHARRSIQPDSLPYTVCRFNHHQSTSAFFTIDFFAWGVCVAASSSKAAMGTRSPSK